ncbi:MAG: hypothetical protein DRI75_04380 [Bacteroidetes bacterium]|nr:MAG: hypothetical protein DRI75_04380 [Bacteroidota bacterium]
MLYTILPSTIRTHLLIEQVNLVTILAIAGVIFLVLMLFGVRKFFKFKAKNGYLSKITHLQSEEDNKVYKNFTDGHLYDSI